MKRFENFMNSGLVRARRTMSFDHFLLKRKKTGNLIQAKKKTRNQLKLKEPQPETKQNKKIVPEKIFFLYIGLQAFFKKKNC